MAAKKKAKKNPTTKSKKVKSPVSVEEVLPELTDAEMDAAVMTYFDDPTDECNTLCVYDHVRWENPHGILLCVDDGTNEVSMSLDYDRVRHLHGVLGSWIATTMGVYHD
jgi:hypothetical protein